MWENVPVICLSEKYKLKKKEKYKLEKQPDNLCIRHSRLNNSLIFVST